MRGCLKNKDCGPWEKNLERPVSSRLSPAATPTLSKHLPGGKTGGRVLTSSDAVRSRSRQLQRTTAPSAQRCHSGAVEGTGKGERWGERRTSTLVASHSLAASCL
ncbi:hypothetical protein E2C01_034895 [Portunus trituberculatus]|uniref:Uncharacterized protein n=1 Tax=Portunus trituberculatus TaxID=210409 RepID=A0A5B7F7K9_PORTR|nr:hypothetical protein [Portunus trituberculatus]